MKSINAAVIGVTGYTGMELVRILAGHPGFSIEAVTSRKCAGTSLQDIFPHLQGTEAGIKAITIPDPELIVRDSRLVFLAVPHAKAMNLAASFLEHGSKVVDLSADFRLNSEQVYSAWYDTRHLHPELLKEAVYGIPELFREDIQKASLVANPGCYPTSAILALYPALKQGIVSSSGIIVDSKSGVTGAGRNPKTETLFCEVSDSLKAYNIGRHRHTPEMEQELSRACGKEVRLSFSPHLAPMSRGILSTCYAELKHEVGIEEIRRIYTSFYQQSPWVRILPQGRLPETRHVRRTMYCDLGLVVDQNVNKLIVVSCIDNLCRGASGQAVANANLMCGFEISEGLEQQPLMP